MGYDNYKIHSDGVIERKDEKIESMLLNIIEVGSHKMNPLGAFLAQRKCFKIAKNERKLDYKEYVERLQLDNYPKEFKRSELGRRLCVISPFAILFSLSSIVFIILSIVEFSRRIGQDSLNRHWDYFWTFLIIAIMCLSLAYFGAIKMIKLSKLIKDVANE